MAIFNSYGSLPEGSVFSSRYLRFIMRSHYIPNFPLHSLLMWSRGQNIWKLGPPQLRLKWFCSACGSTASSQIIATRLRFLECRNTCRLKRGVRRETYLFFRIRSLWIWCWVVECSWMMRCIGLGLLFETRLKLHPERCGWTLLFASRGHYALVPCRLWRWDLLSWVELGLWVITIWLLHIAMERSTIFNR